MRMNLLTSMILVSSSLILLLGFQNCARTAFTPSEEGVTSLKSVDPQGEGLANDDGLSEPIEDADDLADNDSNDEVDEIGGAKNGVRCIGNGIKVPDSAVLVCADGKPKCVQLCVESITANVSFKQARALIKGGATAGACAIP